MPTCNKARCAPIGNPGRPGTAWSRRSVIGAALSGAAAFGIVPAGAFASPNGKTISAEDARALALGRRDELVGLLSELVAIRSLSGESAEAAQNVVKNYLSHLPYRVEESADRPSRYRDHPEFMPPSPAGDGPFVNVVGWPLDDAPARLAMFSHIDTHVVEDGWETDPYEAVIKGNRLHGLGVADDKGGVAAMLVAAAALSEYGGTMPVVMSLHGKGGGSRGSLPVFERIAHAGQSFDAVLYVHPAETERGLADIKNVVQGALDLQMTVEGWRGAPLEPMRPDSALWHESGDALSLCLEIIERLKQGPLAGTEVNVGKLDAGDRTGAVPRRAQANMRVLFGDEHSWTELFAGVQQELQNVMSSLPSGDGGYRAHIQSTGFRTNAAAVGWDTPFCRALRNSIEDVTQISPVSYPNHYAGDIRYPMRLLKAPTFGIGSLGGNFYRANEWVDIDDLVNLVAVSICTMSDWSDLG